MSECVEYPGLKAGDECPDCGYESYGEHDAICKARAGNLMCRVCGSTFANTEMISKEELRALVEQFRQRQEDNERKYRYGSDVHGGIAVGRRRSADDLEELLDE